MVTRLPIALLFVLSLLSVWGSGLYAQTEDPLLEYFALQRDGEAVLLNWVTRPGTTCEGVDIERSTDGLVFERIYHVPGICGGPDEAYSYSHRDEAPIPNYTNTYRLVMGRLGHSTERSIEVVNLGNEGIQVRPQPMDQYGKVYFENSTAEPCKLQLISSDGVVLRALETREFYFEIDGSSLPIGLYFLQVFGADGALLTRGKLVVQH